ncbi:MAG: SUMF1/EgtB/PvdO family nonheme iron enzyme [Planctomycetota bacterium]|nr:SUMF1/EgtB/PvdO family nonheme iron enzyme [Planctomycetota bacterium]
MQKMFPTRVLTLVCLIDFECHLQSGYAIEMETVFIGNSGNAGQLSGAGAGGTGPDATVRGVPYNYRIGKHEVTNAQYVSFLNAVDSLGENRLALFDPGMSLDSNGGIARDVTALAGNKYLVRPGKESYPVNFISWYDAVRFANWLHNGQGPSGTESGAYTLLGDTPIPSSGPSIARNSNAQWFLPDENEWYKAAYHKNDGVTGNYWLYPTRSNVTPSAERPPGGANSASFGVAVGGFTPVGSYPRSAGPYGTLDQGGNAWEWNETAISASFRGLRGSYWSDDSIWLSAPIRNDGFSVADQLNLIGFRVASVPEPNSAAIVGSLLISLFLVRSALGTYNLFPVVSLRARSTDATERDFL